MPRKCRWCIGDLVEVRDSFRVTNLGKGPIIDIAVDSNKVPVSALVRFENGSDKGVWYSLNLLHQISDLQGNPIT